MFVFGNHENTLFSKKHDALMLSDIIANLQDASDGLKE